jgi:hypothetical protein
MSRSITINREELIQDIKIGLGKYKFYFAIFFSSLIMLVGYSQLNYKIDNEIVQLNQEKNYLIAENFKLKKILLYYHRQKDYLNWQKINKE